MSRGRRGPKEIESYLDAASFSVVSGTPLNVRRARRDLEWGRLRDWLSRPRWTAVEAVWILAGFDAENSGEPGRNFRVAWLPGRFKWRRMSKADLERHVEMLLEDIRGFVFGSSRPPRKWLDMAAEADYYPPWLRLALSDDECRRALLGVKLPDRLSGAGAVAPGNIAATERGGIVRNEGTYADLVRQAIRKDWRARQMTGREEQKVTAFTTTMLEDYWRPEGPSGQDKPKTALEASRPSVRNKKPIVDEIRRLQQLPPS